MESSFELKCCVNASSLAIAPPLVVSCHRVPSNSTAVHETFRRAECERCSSHHAHALPCVQVRRGGSRSRRLPESAAAPVAGQTIATWEDATAAQVDLCYLACRFVLQPKILFHSGSLVRFHSRLHLAVVSPRLLQSRHRHLALVILQPRLPLLSSKHPTLALHIPSQVRLHLLRPHPLPCLRLPGRRRSSRRHRPALRTRFWETSNKHRGTSPRPQPNQTQSGQG